MEIRNALQKIENYLTVVSNLNKTILSEGTMSRDELLLMKKYLYTSIDRIEDIERSLIIDKRDEKSFTPQENTVVAPVFTPTLAKENEIVEVSENSNIEKLETAIEDEKSTLDITPVINEIIPEVDKENVSVVGEIEHPALTKEKVEEVVEPVAEVVTPVQNIITEDYALNKVEEPVVEKVTPIENIITEDYALNKAEEKTVEEVRPVITAEEKTETPLINEDKVETIIAEVQKPTSWVDEIANNKKEETSFFEQLEQKLNTTQQPQLFQLFDDKKEDLHETFLNKNKEEDLQESLVNNDSLHTPLAIDLKSTNHSYENESVLVADKVETVIEQLTPSSLNDIFKPQTTTENLTANVSKTLSESIALNDKFIFVRELFGNQFSEYENGLKQLDTLTSFASAENYCQQNLWGKFNWKDRTAAVERFMELLKKRFN